MGRPEDAHVKPMSADRLTFADNHRGCRKKYVNMMPHNAGIPSWSSPRNANTTVQEDRLLFVVDLAGFGNAKPEVTVTWRRTQRLFWLWSRCDGHHISGLTPQ